MKDKRYSIQKDASGWPHRRYVVSLNGRFLASFLSKATAVKYATKHSQKRVVYQGA